MVHLHKLYNIVFILYFVFVYFCETHFFKHFAFCPWFVRNTLILTLRTYDCQIDRLAQACKLNVVIINDVADDNDDFGCGNNNGIALNCIERITTMPLLCWVFNLVVYASLCSAVTQENTYCIVFNICISCIRYYHHWCIVLPMSL